MTTMEDKLDKIVDTLGQQAITLERLTVTVEDHVRRTNLLEEDIKPVKRHVFMVEGALKLMGLIGILAAIAEGIATVMRIK